MEIQVLGTTISHEENPPETTDDQYVVLRINLPIPRDTFEAMSESDRADFERLAVWAAEQILDPTGPGLRGWRLDHLRWRDAEERLDKGVRALDRLRHALLGVPPKRRPKELTLALRQAYQWERKELQTRKHR